MFEKIISIFKSFSKIPGAIQKYGIQNIIITIILSCLLGLMIYVFVNPDVVIKRYASAENKIQTEEYEQRMKVDPIIREDLTALRAETNADRVSIFETHNGGSNINGLKFIYMDMTYDEFRESKEPVAKEYTNLRTSTNTWISFACKKGIWYGSIDDVKDIDLSFYYRLKSVGVESVGVIIMEGTDRPSGALSICYYDKEHGGCGYKITKEQATQLLTKYGSKIGSLLIHIN